MAYFPLASTTDDRSGKGIVPLVLKNVTVEPQAEGAGKRSPFVIAPTHGMTARVTPAAGNLIRGVFSRPGVQNGLLFAVCGNTLYSITQAWAATSIGTIAGTGRVLMDRLGANLVILSSGTLYVWDGSSLTTNVDADFPSDAFTLASLGDRILTSEEGSDTFDWSAVGDATSWPTTGFAASARYPDEIRAQAEIGGDLIHFGSDSIQPWRAVGGSDADAFDTLASVVINRGIIGRDAWAKMDSYAMFVGDDRAIYELSGYVPQRVVNRDLEIALEAFNDPESSSVQCFSYTDGSHLYFVCRLPDGQAYVFDALTRRWHRRTAMGEDRFDIAYYARFFSRHVVAASDDDTIYTWDSDAYDDDGESIERVAMVHIPVAESMPVSNITLDIKTFGQPLSGTGSAPKAYLTFYRDGGSLDSLVQLGIERQVSLGAAGHYDIRPTAHRLGLASGADGILLKIRIPDPVGFAFSGVWVNELPKP